MGYLALHEHCCETRQICVTYKSLDASVNCRTVAIAWREEEEAMEWQIGRKKKLIL